MAKKTGSQKNIQNLIVFEPKGRTKIKKKQDYLVTEKNQEDKITLTNSLTPQGFNFRYSILLKNGKLESITDISLLIVSPNIFKFSGSYPQKLIVSSSLEDIQDKISIINLKFNVLNGKSSEKFYLHYTPSTKLGNGEFMTILKYKNHDGKEKEIRSQSIKIHIEDLNIMPKIVSHSQIREISQIPGMKRTLISLGIGDNKKLNLKKIFVTIEKLIQSYNFQFITKDEEKGILWFYGTESNSSNDLLALCKIGPNTIEIIAYSKNLFILIQFLYVLNNKIREQLLKKKIIKSNTKIYELECVNCGESLPFFPKKGESITCIKCSYEQVLW